MQLNLHSSYFCAKKMHFLLNGFGPVVIEANDTEPRNDVFVIFGCYFIHKSLNERILASFCLFLMQ